MREWRKVDATPTVGVVECQTRIKRDAPDQRGRPCASRFHVQVSNPASLTIILALALLGLALPASAQEKSEPSKWKTVAPIAAWIGCQSADLISTAVALRNPRIAEANPLAQPPLGYVLKISVNVGLGAGYLKLKPSRAKTMLPWIAAVGGCLPAVWNVRTIRSVQNGD